MSLRSARYELKYIVSESQARAIRAYVEAYLPPDQHMNTADGYLVSSLYLDSPDLELYRQTATGHRDRASHRGRLRHHLGGAVGSLGFQGLDAEAPGSAGDRRARRAGELQARRG